MGHFPTRAIRIPLLGAQPHISSYESGAWNLETINQSGDTPGTFASEVAIIYTELRRVKNFKIICGS